MLQIDSPQNPRFKAALRLHSSRGRKQQGRFIVFGERECLRLANSEVEIIEVFVEEKFDSSEMNQALKSRNQSSQIITLAEDLFQKLSFGDRADGVIAIATRPDCDLPTKISGPSLAVVLESIEKPGNLGAILRTCDGAGVDHVILANPLTDFFHPNCIRASMGAVFSMTLFKGTTEAVQEYLNQNGYEAFGALVGSAVSYDEIDLRSDRCALVFGNEASGLSDAWRTDRIQPIGIPMKGTGDSLNVSVAVGIVAYQAASLRKSS